MIFGSHSRADKTSGMRARCGHADLRMLSTWAVSDFPFDRQEQARTFVKVGEARYCARSRACPLEPPTMKSGCSGEVTPTNFGNTASAASHHRLLPGHRRRHPLRHDHGARRPLQRPSHRHQAEGPQEIVTAIEVRRGNRQLCAPGPNCDVVKLAIASMPDVVDTTGVGWRHRRLSTRRRALDKLARHDPEDPTGGAARRHHRLQDRHRLRHHARPILHDCGQIVSAP